MGALTRLNRAWFPVAVVLILGYLIARPHLGTVYLEGMKVVKMDWSNAELEDAKKKPWAVKDEFPTKLQCDHAVERDEKIERDAQIAAAAVSGRLPPFTQLFHCRSQTRLLWGW